MNYEKICIFVALITIIQKEEYGYYTILYYTILKAFYYRYNIVSVIHYQFEIAMANFLNLITLIFGLGTGEIIILFWVPVIVILILLIKLLYELIKKL